jgi:HD-like signal output (HDOD) protein
LKAQGSLRVIAEPLSRLWEKSIAVASICQVLARRTRVPPEEAFLTGLLHGIGRLYIMVRAADDSQGSRYDHALADMVADWHPSIGKAVLENWGFVEAMSDAVGDQANYERKAKREADLTDVLIVGILLADALQDCGERLRHLAFDSEGVHRHLATHALSTGLHARRPRLLERKAAGDRSPASRCRPVLQPAARAFLRGSTAPELPSSH